MSQLLGEETNSWVCTDFPSGNFLHVSLFGTFSLYVRLLNISTPTKQTRHYKQKLKVVAPTFTHKIGDDNTYTPQVQEEAFPGCFTWHDRFHQKFAKHVAGFSLVSICLAIV